MKMRRLTEFQKAELENKNGNIVKMLWHNRKRFLQPSLIIQHHHTVILLHHIKTMVSTDRCKKQQN